jgi:lactate permease
MEFAALIPFVIVLVCFIGLKFPLTIASFIALLASSVLCQTIFSMTEVAWQHAILRTFEISIEIGLVLLGAFLFLEVAKKTKTIDSLATLIRQVSPNRIVQAVLVIFPLEMMVEGSSGFGTPLLITTPILFALGLDVGLCVLLPLLNCVIAIPFGALGTPIRLGFPIGSVNPTEVFIIFLPLLFISPLFSAFQIQKKLKFREAGWIVFLSSIFALSAWCISHYGPEFTTLGPAFITFAFGLISARFLFQDGARKQVQEFRGLFTYGVLLIAMWIGKQIFMDQLIPGTHIRIFNPGIVFVLFASIMHAMNRSKGSIEILKSTFARSKQMLTVFFCMAFIVQELRECGALGRLSEGLPSFLLGGGSPILGWLGSMLIGTSTVTNLLLSKVVDPLQFAGLAAGSAIGVQMAFQSLVAMKSVSHNQLSEKEIFLKIMPVSVAYITICTLWYIAWTRFTQ